jgi:hypothetical protein
MNQYALRLPDSLFEAARKLAEADNVSMNQFFAIAIAEKVAALTTADYLAERGQGADLDAYRAVLAKKVKANPPVPGDGWPDRAE